jgi:VIT1/CCC1 family predicted Fe2+/Mn2+ transporter
MEVEIPVDVNDRGYLTKTLVENWRREMEAAQLYELSGQSEKDPRKKEILGKLADIEYKHARMWETKLTELDFDVKSLKRPGVSIKGMTTAQVMKQIDDVEHGNAAWYQSLRNVVSDEGITKIIDEIDIDEANHEQLDVLLESPQGAQKRLDRIWKSERHGRGSHDWVGDAIYGVNDGLGAIFGIIAGVAGYTTHTHTILVSGFFGALASTLSMGAGAYLAAKSENEVMETTMAQEKAEIAEDPEHEMEELALLYQLKGFSADESHRIADQIAEDPDQFLKTMVQEEFGFHEASRGNPWRSALFGSISTLVGGIIPLLPLFFMRGFPAMIAAALVSIAAHFAVGAAKSAITVRSWWSSGLEMTAVGIIVGVVSYGLGTLAAFVFGTSFA